MGVPPPPGISVNINVTEIAVIVQWDHHHHYYIKNEKKLLNSLRSLEQKTHFVSTVLDRR